MTNPGNSSESPKKGFKVTLTQGIVGAVSLAATTAIPLLVQRAINPPTPTPSPAQSTPAEIKPAQVTPATAAPQIAPAPVSSQERSETVKPEDENKGKGKKKGKKDD
jgi:hypothetical protein